MNLNLEVSSSIPVFITKQALNVDSIIVIRMLSGDMMCNARHEAIVRSCEGLINTLDREIVGPVKILPTQLLEFN